MPGWGPHRAVSLHFEDAAAISHDAAHLARLESYTSDLVRPFDSVHAEAPGAGRGQSYGEMAEKALDALLPSGETVDLLILAYGIPDVTPGRATTTYLSHVCPGNPLAFALSDQGTAVAFTGLRLAREYTGRCVLLIAEQAELPYPAPNLPTAHAIVALLLGDSPTARVERIAIEPGVPPSELDERLHRLARSYDKPLVLLGSSLERSTLDGARIAPPGLPATGVWTLLAEELSGSPSGTVVLADYDPHLGYLSTASIQFS